MVKLTSPLVHGGRIIPVGMVIHLGKEFEETLIRKGHAVEAPKNVEPPEQPPEEVGKRGKK